MPKPKGAPAEMLSIARDLKVEVRASEAAAAPAVVVELSVFDDIEAIGPEWTAFERIASGHVFQTFDFAATWLAHVGRARGIVPRIVVGRDRNGMMLMLLPMGLRHRLGARMLEWVGGEHADYHAGLFDARLLAALAAEDGASAALVESVVGLFADEADLVHFERQPTDINGFANPFAAWRSVPYSARSHLTRLGRSWDAYYRSKRNSSSRRHDRLKWQKLNALAPAQIIDAGEPAEIEGIVSVLFAQKRASLAERGVPDLFARPGVADFYRALAMKPHPRGITHVSAIRQAGEIVAANWGLVHAGRYYYVMTSYDPTVAAHSPGRALMHHLMQWSIARGIEVFDFTIGDEEFKGHWCEESAELRDSVAVLTARGAPLATALRAAKTVKRFVKRRPPLRRAAGRLRRWMG
jgi:CelD/BcsL family acetyltransferase involved in cellulose biosynthesis